LELTALEETDADFFGTYGDDITPGIMHSAKESNSDSCSETEEDLGEMEEINTQQFEADLDYYNSCFDLLETPQSVNIADDPSDSSKTAKSPIIKRTKRPRKQSIDSTSIQSPKKLPKTDSVPTVEIESQRHHRKLQLRKNSLPKAALKAQNLIKHSWVIQYHYQLCRDNGLIVSLEEIKDKTSDTRKDLSFSKHFD
jgi:hypothetical protein